jgi:HNH endonuclease
MSSYLSATLRLLVAQRADYRCEYCWLPMASAIQHHEPDHIVPVQHGGISDDQNLAFACFRCNRNKGPNIGSFDPVTGLLTPFFNPRIHEWEAHFVWCGVVIVPLTPEARVTIKILRLNDEVRLQERQRLMQLNLY